MNQEDSLDFKQTFNIDFSAVAQPEPVQKSRKSKYIKIGLLIFASIAIITTVILLVGHYKYGLFEDEVYQVANVKHEIYSTEYFTETKTVKSKLSYSSGELNERVQKITTNFLVTITDKETLPNNEILTKATIVLLQSKAESEGNDVPLSTFDIFNENILKEFENNPNDEKYQMAVFSFYESGAIKDINLPKGMNKEDAQNLIDLINNVVPKLTRNKKEDNENGLEITTRTGKKKKTFVEYQPPKEYIDKYTKSQFKGSKITKTVERDIEDEKITEIRTNTNLFLETQKEDTENYIEFGLKDFYYDTSSVIVATESEENNVDKVNIVKKYVSKLDLIDGEKLIESIIEKEKEEQKKQVEETAEEVPVTTNQLRNLGWDGKFGWDWQIASSNILGQTVKVVYSISLASGKVKNVLKLVFNSFEVPLGNKDGTSSNKSSPKKEAGEKEVGQIPLGSVAVTLSVKIGGKLSFDVNFANNLFTLKLGGEAYAKAGVVFGLKNVLEFDFGVKGTLISCDFTTKIKKSGSSYSKSSINIKASAGKVSVYATGKVAKVFTLFNESYEIWKGWSLVKITW
jgi:hypothetical protein